MYFEIQLDSWKYLYPNILSSFNISFLFSGDSFLYQNSMDFSTFDKDNDMKESSSCAQMCTAAWWYNACRHSNLNGVYGSNTIGGIIWSSWKGHSYSLSASKMLIKKI